MSFAVITTVVPVSSADQVVRRDARHDVAVGSDSDDYGMPQPGRVDPDVLRTIVAHRDHRVIVRLRLAEVHRRATGRRLIVGVETPARGLYSVSVDWRRNGTATWQIEGYPDVVDCPQLKAELNARRDFIRVGIPRHCLGDPRWVRIYMETWRVANAGLVLVDDPLRSGRYHWPLGTTHRLYRS